MVNKIISMTLRDTLHRSYSICRMRAYQCMRLRLVNLNHTNPRGLLTSTYTSPRTKPTLLHEIFVLIEPQHTLSIRVVTNSDLRTQHARALLSSFEVLVTPLTTGIRMHTHPRIIGTQAHTLPITHSRSTSSPTRSWHLCLRVFAPWESTFPSAG